MMEQTPVDMRVPRKKPNAKVEKKLNEKAELLKARIKKLNEHFADPAVNAAIEEEAKETFKWLQKNKKPWWPAVEPSSDKDIRRIRQFDLLCRAYGQGQQRIISELFGNGWLLADETYSISLATSYQAMALIHELVGRKLRKEVLKIHENPDDDAVGLNDVAKRFDYDNPTNVRDQFVDLMATFGLWTVKIDHDFEIRVGPVAYAFHMHALNPILDEFEPKI